MESTEDLTQGDLGLSVEEGSLQSRRTSSSMCDLSRPLTDGDHWTLSACVSFDSLTSGVIPSRDLRGAPLGLTDCSNYPDEVTSLQSELDVCRRLLNAKYLAANILLKQLLKLSEEKEEGNQLNRQQCKDLFRELNSLQYELQCMEEHLRTSQHNWLDKLNGLAEENSENRLKVRTQGELIRELGYRVQVLKREREELLALLDVKERDMYLQSCAEGAEKCYEPSFLEVAVLAACTCRGPKQEPCRCAHAVSYKQHQLNNVMDKVKDLEAQVRDTTKTLDIYREAFEAQLARNRQLTRRVTELQSRRDLLDAIAPNRKWCNPQKGVIDDLVEKLCDKNEAIVHQQLMLKLLAQQINNRADLQHTSSRES